MHGVFHVTEKVVKLGFLTAPFPETPLMEVADWAASADFEVLEIACWPQSIGATRKYAGTSHIDVANLSDAQAGEIKLTEIIKAGGFGNVKRATETPFNMILEARA